MKVRPAANDPSMTTDSSVQNRFFVRSSLILWALVVVYGLAGFILAYTHGVASHFKPVTYLGTAALFTGVFAIVYAAYLVLRVYWVMIFVRPPKLALWLMDDLKKGPLNRERFIQALPVFPAFIVVFSIFSSMKMMISAIHAFSWDQAFATMDRSLHFGHDPWRILQPLMGFPLVTFIVNVVYNFWLPAVFLTLYWQLFSLKDPRARMQFFYAFILTWAINGTFLAIAFSSVGPCYYHDATGGDYYAALMNYLHQANDHYKIWALNTQRSLWDSYKNSEFMIGGGISAMPSVHVSTALLFLLLALKLKSRFWPLYAAFFTFILFGSVHLAWHYAIDGYAGILLTLPIWLASGFLVKLISEPKS